MTEMLHAASKIRPAATALGADVVGVDLAIAVVRRHRHDPGRAARASRDPAARLRAGRRRVHAARRALRRARGLARLQPLARRVRRGIAEDDGRVQRDRGRQAGRRSRRRRAQLAHRPGLRGAAVGLHVPARARSSADGRQHELRQHVQRLRAPRPTRSSSRSRASRSSTRKATPRRAFRGPGYRDIETSDPRELPGPAASGRAHASRVRSRKALYLGRRFGAYIPGLPLAESEAMLDLLWVSAARPEDVWTQQWQVGDLIIWDNRCTMHRRDAFTGQGRRRMHRLTTLGERPQ